MLHVTETLSIADYIYVLADGNEHLDINAIDLDTHEQVGNIELTVNTYDRSRDATVEDTETETVADDAGATDLRVSGRYISMEIVSDEVDGHFQLGKPVLFKKGVLGAAGSNKFLFDHVGLVEAHHPDLKTDLEAAAIEAILPSPLIDILESVSGVL
mgnify:CR=1 FL=1